ncbi:MAG TPA: hypothetical protein VMU25_01100 [Candidatus Paceibacterota bacterium]|nr:hypothetical protein [Candidatus Paceibacterota bacterium]
MKKILVVIPTLLTLALPLFASAHEMATYNIGGSMYQIVIGSLNEPVAVDDKTGVDLTVSKCTKPTCAPTMSPDGDMDGPAGTPVNGLDQTLKVTLIAGQQKKTLALSPQEGTEGKYTAPFYPTVATTLSYELTGTINGTPVDLSYTCLPEGTPKAPLDTAQKELSNGVTQMSVSGGFGCPVPKEDMGFPEQSASIHALASETGSTQEMAIGALALSVIGIVLGGTVAFMRRKN